MPAGTRQHHGARAVVGSRLQCLLQLLAQRHGERIATGGVVHRQDQHVALALGLDAHRGIGHVHHASSASGLSAMKRARCKAAPPKNGAMTMAFRR